MDTATLLHDTVPDGVEIRADNKGGSGIFSTRDVKLGELVCNFPVIFMPPDTGKFTLQTQYGTYTINGLQQNHMTADDQAQRFYGFGNLTNHSCDPSTHSQGSIYVDGKLMLPSIALRDIKAGEEVNEDYNLDCWNAFENGFDCMCGSRNCRGRMSGFMNLPYDDQCKLLGQMGDHDHDMHKNKREMWLKFHPEVMFHHLVIPESVALTRCFNSTHGLKIVASKAFGKGDIIYTVEYFNIDTNVVKKIIISCPHPDAPNTLKETCIIDLHSKTSDGNGKYQFCDIDEFKSSSSLSDLNTTLTRTGSTRYTVTAKRDINENEDIN